MANQLDKEKGGRNGRPFLLPLFTSKHKQMKVIGVRNLNEDLGSSYMDMMHTANKSQKGLKSMGIDPNLAGRDALNGKNTDQRRVEKRAKVSCVFAKDMASLQNNSLDNVVMNKVACVYTRLKKDSLFRFSIRNKIDERFVEFKINDINPEAGFEPDMYDISIVKNDNFDPKLDSSYRVLQLIMIKDTKNNF